MEDPLYEHAILVAEPGAEAVEELLSQLRSIKWPRSKRSNVSGVGATLGLSGFRDGTRVCTLKGKAKNFIRSANNTLMSNVSLKDLKQQTTSIQVTKDAISSRHKDTGNQLGSRSIACGLGTYSGGELCINNEKVIIKDRFSVSTDPKNIVAWNFRENDGA